MPNTYTTLSSLFTAIANAIRAKTGSQAQIVADNFPSEIANIPTGVDTSDATATDGDILSGKTAYLADGTKHTGSMADRGSVDVTLDTTTTSYTVPSGKHSGSGTVKVVTQTKSATPSGSAQTVSADSGKVLSSVSVSAIQTQTKSVNPSTSAQTVTPDSGKYLTSVSVGAISTQTKSATPSTSAQTITPDNGKYLTSVSVGAIPNQRSGSQGTITPSSSAQTVYVPSGWHNGNTYFSVGAASGGISSGATLVETLTWTGYEATTKSFTKCKNGKNYCIVGATATSYPASIASVGSLSEITDLKYGTGNYQVFYMNGSSQPSVTRARPIGAQTDSVKLYEFS